jgi:hypothetical protein
MIGLAKVAAIGANFIGENGYLPWHSRQRVRPRKGDGMRRYVVSPQSPGWTARLGDIGRQLGITAVAAGRMLDLMGYRSDGCGTSSAMAAGFGVPRWNDFTMQNDWHLDRVLAAIRSAAQDPEKPAIADALAAAVAKQQDRERAMARQREQKETEAARREEEEAVVSGLEVELRTLRATDPGMSLLDAVEYITCEPAHRVALYRRCAEDGDIQAGGRSQDDPRLLKSPRHQPWTSPSLSDAPGAKGFESRMNRDSALEGSRTGFATVRCPSPARRRI